MLGNYSYLLIILILVFFIIREYKGLNNFLYVKFKQAYREYTKFEITGSTYEDYVRNFILANQFITGESGQELNKKNLEINYLFDFLINGKELVDKYFSGNDFSYRQYKILKTEWATYLQKPVSADFENIFQSNNTTEPAINHILVENIELKKDNKIMSFDDLITLNDEEKRNIIVEKVEIAVKLGIKGKKVALLIIALKELGYLSSLVEDNIIFNAIRKKFGPNINIGTDSGIYSYLDEKKQKGFAYEIELLKDQFRLE